MTILLLAAGLVALGVGAELLVRGASRLARAVGISPLVVGLTVVAFGTSAPEAAASLAASLAGKADLALGNVVGSNIFNVFGILGLAAVVAPLGVAVRLIRIDAPIVLVASIVVAGLAADGVLGRWEGLLLLAVIIGHTIWLVRASRLEAAAGTADAPAPVDTGPSAMGRAVLLVVAGLVGLVAGAGWLVDGAVAVAVSFGLTERVIGLTLVAAGTSFPELATSVVAAFRGQREIAVGNVIGSNLFNLTVVLGIAVVGSPAGVAVAESVLRVDVPVMVLSAAVCLPVLFTGFEITRREGLAMVTTLVVYVAWIVTHSAGHTVSTWVTAALVGLGTAALAVTVVGSLVQIREGQRQR
jgi:cation:H+ antiporter